MICNHYSALQMADLDACQYRRKDINSMFHLTLIIIVDGTLDENDIVGTEGREF